MKVLVLAPPHETVPPTGYGGTESVVDLLVRHLSNDPSLTVLLASAAGSSVTHPAMHHVRHAIPALRTLDASDQKKRLLETHYLAEAFRQAEEKGIALIHNHAGESAMRMLPQNVPALTTMHCFPQPDTGSVWKRYKGYWNSISKREYETVGSPGGTHIGTVLNGIDVPSFPFGDASEKEPYLFFIGRFSPEKGAHIAIRIAKRLGLKILLAAKAPDKPDDEHYFTKTLAPMLQAYSKAEYVGEAGPQEKRALYQRAMATLCPIQWEEPFGLVLAESLACGTPVIAFPKGATPEIISHGITGYLPTTEEEMLAAVRAIDRLDPRACRREAEERFDGSVMAKNYRALYDTVAAEHELPAVRSRSA